GERRQRVYQAPRQRAGVGQLRAERQAPYRGAGEGEQVVDEPLQAGELAPHDGQVGATAGGSHTVVPQRGLQVAADRGDGGAQLVRDRGDELLAGVEQAGDAIPLGLQVEQDTLEIGRHGVEATRKLPDLVGRPFLDAGGEVAGGQRLDG